MADGWGRIMIGTRLEKTVLAEFVECWSQLLTIGIRKGDAFSIVSGKPAHWAANDLVRRFLASDCETLFFVDSDAQIDGRTLHALRDLEEGWPFDVLSGFYVRRGWPPEAIWMSKQSDGLYKNNAVLREVTLPVDAVGLHNVLVRRRVFETLKGPDWFYYPKRDEGSTRPQMSEDVAWSEDVLKAGFSIGSTSCVKTGHYSTIATGWETHHEWLRLNNIIEKHGVDTATGAPLVPEMFVSPNGVKQMEVA